MTDIEAHIRSRCIECADCLIWQGSTNARGHPKLHNRSARRAMWEAMHGPLAPDQLVTTTCESPLCMEHLAITDKREAGIKGYARPDTRLRRAVQNARIARARAKINANTARDIRASDKTGKDLAAELGVSESLISLVRNHKAWKDYSNPFAGLGA